MPPLCQPMLINSCLPRKLTASTLLLSSWSACCSLLHQQSYFSEHIRCMQSVSLSLCVTRHVCKQILWDLHAERMLLAVESQCPSSWPIQEPRPLWHPLFFAMCQPLILHRVMFADAVSCATSTNTGCLKPYEIYLKYMYMSEQLSRMCFQIPVCPLPFSRCDDEASRYNLILPCQSYLSYLKACSLQLTGLKLDGSRLMNYKCAGCVSVQLPLHAFALPLLDTWVQQVKVVFLKV